MNIGRNSNGCDADYEALIEKLEFMAVNRMRALEVISEKFGLWKSFVDFELG